MLIEGMNYILEMKNRGVNIRMMHASWAGPASTFSQAEKDTLQSLIQAGILIVTAAGNFSSSTLAYPGSYSLDGIINVANLALDGTLMPSSNFGRCHVDLGAPGQNIIVANATSDNLETASFGFQQVSDGGTSFSSPHVTGVAAVLASHFPTASLKKIKWAILKAASEFPHATYTNADGTPNNSKTTLTGGILNARRAYEFLSQNLNVPDSSLPSVGWADCNDGNVTERPGGGGGGGGAGDLWLGLLMALAALARGSLTARGLRP
jgi:subtilisin family serine protease